MPSLILSKVMVIVTKIKVILIDLYHNVHDIYRCIEIEKESPIESTSNKK